MLRFAIVLLAIALLAAFFFGFGEVWEGAKILFSIGFLICLVLAVLAFLRDASRRRSV